MVELCLLKIFCCTQEIFPSNVFSFPSQLYMPTSVLGACHTVGLDLQWVRTAGLFTAGMGKDRIDLELKNENQYKKGSLHRSNLGVS